MTLKKLALLFWIIVFANTAWAKGTCQRIFHTSTQLNSIEKTILQDFFSLWPTRDTLQHRWRNEPPKRLLSDELMNSKALDKVIPLPEFGENAHIVLIAKLGGQRYVAEMGIGIVNARVLRGRNYHPGQSAHEFKLKQRLIQLLREDSPFTPENPKFRITAVDGRIELKDQEIWVSEHNAGVTPSELRTLAQKPSHDPRKISDLELSLAETNLKEFRQSLKDFFHRNGDAANLLGRLEWYIRDIPERAFIYHNGRWHLDIMAL